MRDLTENDYKVLTKVFDKTNDKGFSRATGSTIEDIKEKIDFLSESKIRSAIKALIEYEYVSKGVKKGKKDTFYITALGLTDLKNLNKKSINIIKGDGINE
jgi:DNA-binding transcriptional regulator GbsR (MarR family)